MRRWYNHRILVCGSAACTAPMAMSMATAQMQVFIDSPKLSVVCGVYTARAAAHWDPVFRDPALAPNPGPLRVLPAQVDFLAVDCDLQRRFHAELDAVGCDGEHRDAHCARR